MSLDLAFGVGLLVQRKRLDAARRPVPGAIRLPPIRARLANGEQFAPAASAKCTLFRYADPLCPYCRAEVSEATRLDSLLEQGGCAVVGLAPSRSLVDRSSPEELVYIGMDWLSAGMRLQGEPTAFVLNRSGECIWSSVGEMPAGSAPGAARAIFTRLGLLR